MMNNIGKSLAFLQLAFGDQSPKIRSINTLDALVRLADFSWIHADEYRRLVSAYSFFRTIEHSLQLALPELGATRPGHGSARWILK